MTSSAVESNPFFQTLHKGVFIAVKNAQGCKLSTYISLEYFRYFGVFEFLRVKSDARALHLMVESMRSWLPSVSAPRKDLAFALLILELKHWGVRMMSIWLWTCQLGACQDAWQGWVGGSLQSLGVSVLCRFFLQCQIFLLSLPSFGMHQGLLWNFNRLELQAYPSWESLNILLGSLCYDAIKLLVELFVLLVFVVWGWCIDLNNCNFVWSHWDLDGDGSAGDASAADDTTYNFFLYNECQPILVFRVFSSLTDLVSSSVVVSPNSVHLTLARPRVSQWQHFNQWVSSCTFPQACRQQTFHFPIVPAFGSLMVGFAPAAHFSPPPWSLTVGSADVVDSGLDWSGMLFFWMLLSSSCPFSGLGESLAAPKFPRTGSSKHTSPSLGFTHQQKQLPGCGWENVLKPLWEPVLPTIPRPIWTSHTTLLVSWDLLVVNSKGVEPGIGRTMCVFSFGSPLILIYI